MDLVLEKIEELLSATERFIDKEDQRTFNKLVLRIRRIWLRLSDEHKLARGVIIRELLDDMRKDMENLDGVRPPGA